MQRVRVYTAISFYIYHIEASGGWWWLYESIRKVDDASFCWINTQSFRTYTRIVWKLTTAAKTFSWYSIIGPEGYLKREITLRAYIYIKDEKLLCRRRVILAAMQPPLPPLYHHHLSDHISEMVSINKI